MNRLNEALAILLLGATCSAQRNVACPVVPTLASVKTGWSETEGYKAENTIAIWYRNQGKSPVRGVQFKLLMLDGAGNTYPAHKLLIADGRVEPQKGDLIWVDNKDEKEAFGDTWELIQGVQVEVVRVLYSDLTVWVPSRSAQCARKYMNDEYDKALDERNKIYCADSRNSSPPPGHSKDKAYVAGWKAMHDAMCGSVEKTSSQPNRAQHP